MNGANATPGGVPGSQIQVQKWTMMVDISSLLFHPLEYSNDGSPPKQDDISEKSTFLVQSCNHSLCFESIKSAQWSHGKTVKEAPEILRKGRALPPQNDSGI